MNSNLAEWRPQGAEIVASAHAPELLSLHIWKMPRQCAITPRWLPRFLHRAIEQSFRVCVL